MVRSDLPLVKDCHAKAKTNFCAVLGDIKMIRDMAQPVKGIPTKVETPYKSSYKVVDIE